MQSKKIELQDIDSNAPLLPYLRRLFNALNKEICLFYLPFNYPSMYSVPFIEHETRNLFRNNGINATYSKNSFNKENKVELIKTIYVYRHSKEFCFIESSIDSIRVSLKFYLKCEFEKMLFNQLTIFMRKNSDFLSFVRKESIEGFDMSFLVTNRILNTSAPKCIEKEQKLKDRFMGKYDIIHFILKFVVDIDRQIQDKVLQSTYFSRQCIRKLFQEINLDILNQRRNISSNLNNTEDELNVTYDKMRVGCDCIEGFENQK
ncbi:Actin-related protein 2/3 complex subunit 4 [Cryptosporidium felis]|nr:Actin-related protein 2/3 complex subunit 4 [Cryptosporidium felis]